MLRRHETPRIVKGKVRCEKLCCVLSVPCRALGSAVKFRKIAARIDHGGNAEQGEATIGSNKMGV